MNNELVEFDEIKKHLNSPGGLKAFGPYFILSLFTHPALVCKTAKDVNEMADKFVFFHNDEVVFVLTLPWNHSFGPDRTLTEKYDFLLDLSDEKEKLAAIKKILKDGSNG